MKSNVDLLLSRENRWSACKRSYDLGYVLKDSHQSWYTSTSPRSYMVKSVSGAWTGNTRFKMSTKINHNTKFQYWKMDLKN